MEWNLNHNLKNRGLFFLLCLLSISLIVVVGLKFENVHEANFLFDRSDTSTIGFGFTPLASQEIRLAFTGDIMLGRGVERLTNDIGLDSLFASVSHFLNSFDAVVGNLEGPIDPNHVPTPRGGMSFTFKPAVIDILRSNNFKAVSLGNNHALDQGRAVYNDTRSLLASASISSFGTADSVDGDLSWAELPIRDKSVVLFGFNATWPSYRQNDAVHLIKSVIASTSADMQIVFIHWGQEYMTIANENQQIMAREFIDAGIDLVLGHHPHVVQNFDSYKGKPIVYSLGNFIFDQYFSDEVQNGLVVGLKLLDDSHAELTLFPYRSKASMPRLYDDIERFKWIGEYMNEFEYEFDYIESLFRFSI